MKTERKAQRTLFLSGKCQERFASPTDIKKAYVFDCQLLFSVKFKKFICGEDCGRKEKAALGIWFCVTFFCFVYPLIGSGLFKALYKQFLS